MSAYTSSHSLAELSEAMRRQPLVSAVVNCTEKDKIMLEQRRGAYMEVRLVPTNGQTLLAMHCTQPGTMTSYHSIDLFEKEDWDFCKKRLSRSKDVRRMRNLMQALELCAEAARKDVTDPTRMQIVEQAIKVSPDLCSRAYYMKFEVLCSSVKVGDNLDQREMKRITRPLKDAIAAGRSFKELIRADEFAKGNLHTFVPTRWYVRSLYSFGSFLFIHGELDEANRYLQECLANDIHDKLGARHKQLLLSLECEQGPGSEEVRWLLKAKFGDDQMEDTVYALWNYTRALNAFSKKGDCKKSNKLLCHAISKNSHIPPLLMGWELLKEPEIFMEIGSESEAGDYAADNVKHWLGVKGALEWLEQVYCKETSASPLSTDKESMLLLVEGTRLMVEEDAHQQAIDRFERLLQRLNQDRNTNPMMHSKVLQHKAICHNKLLEHDTALRHYNSALRLCDPRDKDAIKELLYNRAQCKEKKGDLNGALQDFTFVYQRIGLFSTAEAGIKRLEAKLKTKTSALPTYPDIGVYENGDDMRETMENISKLVPRVDPQTTVAANLERCYHCQRGGLKLSHCLGCRVVRYCCKECQVASWKRVHKFLCKASVHKLENGAKVVICELENAPHHNGKAATIVRFLEDKKRFCVELEGSDGKPAIQLSIQPKNLKKQDGGSTESK